VHKNDINLYNSEALETMDKLIEQGIVVDAIICDPPYGTTKCKWDSVIDFNEMWERLNKLIKPNGAIVLFGSEPFSSALRMSNIKNYKYDWIWEKSMPTGLANSSFMPMKYHENISIFVNNSKPTFNKQMAERSEVGKKRASSPFTPCNSRGKYMGEIDLYQKSSYDKNKVNPKTLLRFNSVSNAPKGNKLHPTQKPVPLMEYLIKTYTNENELVLDFTMGSGTTGVACKNLDRNFIGIELDASYFEIAKDRIESVRKKIKNEEKHLDNVLDEF